MTQPDFPNGGIPIGVELAFGADIDGDQYLWDWTNLTPLFMSQTVTTTRGRADESSDVSPTAASPVMDNPDGDLTPDNPMSAYWPNVDLGTPARWWVEASLPRLYLRPLQVSSAEVASSAALNITSDLDVRIDMHLKSMDPSGTPAAIVGRADAANPYSWRIQIYPDRTVELLWSATGTVPPLTALSTTPVLPMSARTTLRVTLDVNNGSGGRTITFYVGDSVTGPFTQVGPAVVQAGTTSIANVAEPLIVGSAADLPPEYAPDASVYAFQLLDGINGTALADADFTAQTSGAGSFVDSAGRTWTIFPRAELTNRWFRIVGTVDSWEPVWPWGDLSDEIPGGVGEGEARVNLEVAGILRRLGQGASPLESPLQRQNVAESTVQAYWPMEDGSDSTQIASAVPGGAPMAVSGVVDFASDDELIGSKSLPTLTASSALYGSVTGTFNGRWKVNWYVHLPATLPGAVTLLRATGTGTIVTWLVSISGTTISVSGLDGFGTSVTSGSASGAGMFDQWVNVQLTAEQDGVNVDWALAWYPIIDPIALGATFSGSLSGSVGVITAVAYPADADGAGIAMGHLSVLDAAGVSTPSDAAIAWAGETAADRMARLCAEQGISFRIIGDPATTERMGAQQIATLLTLLDDAADADSGILYEQPDAVGLLYRTRESMYNQPPNMVLDAHQQQIQNPFQPILDDQRVRNDVTVTRVGGSSVRVIDADSVERRGTYDDSVTLNLYADTQISGAAGWRLHQGTVPGMRYPALTTNLGVAPEVIDDWLTTDVGSQVHVINLPPQHPSETVRVIAEGYSEPISPTTWEPEMNCSPASVWDVAVIDGDGVTDQYLLRLDTDGSELTLDVDATDTTFVVTVTDGPPWTSDNAETPFDIRINGERVTVTDVDAPVGSEAMIGAGDAEDSVVTASFVAPSVVAPAAGDLLICAWASYTDLGTYILPGGMTSQAHTDGIFASVEDATQVLGAGGATGTRTATFSTTDLWSAVSAVAHGAGGTPVIEDHVSDVNSGDEMTLITASATIGWWLVVINVWDWDPGDNMGPPNGGGWQAVADSMLANADTSRTRVWAKAVTQSGPQVVTLPIVSGIGDNHGRVYLLSGVTGVTQDFTVTRSVNGVVRAHPAGTPLSLWNTPVLAR